jgi:hypothetical protein
MQKADKLGPAAFPDGSPEREEATRRLKDYQAATSKAFQEQAATETDKDVKDQLLSAAARAANAPTVESISEISTNATRTASTTASQKVKTSRDYEMADKILEEAKFTRDPESPKIPLKPSGDKDQIGAIDLARAPKQVEKTHAIAKRMVQIVNEIGSSAAIRTGSVAMSGDSPELRKLSMLASEFEQLRNTLIGGYVGKGAFTGVLSNQDLERLDRLVPSSLKSDNILEEWKKVITTNKATLLGNIASLPTSANRNYLAIQKEYGVIGPKITFE